MSATVGIVGQMVGKAVTGAHGHERALIPEGKPRSSGCNSGGGESASIDFFINVAMVPIVNFLKLVANSSKGGTNPSKGETSGGNYRYFKSQWGWW